MCAAEWARSRGRSPRWRSATASPSASTPPRRQWNGREATAQDGSTTRPDFLVCNADVLSACDTFLKATTPPGRATRLAAAPLSTSGFILFLGVRGRDPRLGHHNIFFSDRLPARVRRNPRAKNQPDRAHHLHLRQRAHRSRLTRRRSHDNYFVLVNAPARDPNQPWTPDRGSAAIVISCSSASNNSASTICPQRIVAEQHLHADRLRRARPRPPRRALRLGLAFHPHLAAAPAAPRARRAQRLLHRRHDPSRRRHSAGSAQRENGGRDDPAGGRMKSFTTYREPPAAGWTFIEKFTFAAFVFWSVGGPRLHLRAASRRPPIGAMEPAGRPRQLRRSLLCRMATRSSSCSPSQHPPPRRAPMDPRRRAPLGRHHRDLRLRYRNVRRAHRPSLRRLSLHR